MAIFSKEKENQTTPRSPSTRAEAAQGTRTSIIGPKVVIEGTVSGTETLLVEGHIRGNIDLQADLRIGDTARVEATVHAINVLVEGTLIGDLSADKKVELVASAVVDGNIKAPKIVVAEGAKFRGSVDMGSERPRQ